MSPLKEALIEVSTALESLSIPHMVVGGMAVALWGEPRATLDVDCSVWVEEGAFGATVTELCRRFRPLTNDPVEFVRRTRVLPLTTSTGVRADLIFAGLPWERQAIERAQPKSLAGATVPVVSIEDLILMKLLSEREKDLADGRKLIARFKNRLDLAYLEPLLAETAESMGRSDILALLDEMRGDPGLGPRS